MNHSAQKPHSKNAFPSGTSVTLPSLPPLSSAPPATRPSPAGGPGIRCPGGFCGGGPRGAHERGAAGGGGEEHRGGVLGSEAHPRRPVHGQVGTRLPVTCYLLPALVRAVRETDVMYTL